MYLDRKYAEVPAESREQFLRDKYRELRLINRLDRLTDRYNSIGRLMHRALQVIVKTFKCEVAAFLLLDGAKRDDHGFYAIGVGTDPLDPKRHAVHAILSQFLSEPTPQTSETVTAGDHRQAGVTNYLIVPMVITSQLEGAFFIGNRAEALTDRDRYFLSVISSQLDNAVVHCRLLEEHRNNNSNLRQRVRELNTLYEMSLSLSYGSEFEVMATKVIESAMDLVGADRASMMLYDANEDDLRTALVAGEKQKIRLVKLGMGKGIAGLALMSGKPILAQMGCEDERFVPFQFSGIKPRKIHSLISMPLMTGDKPLGVINFVMLTRKKTFNNQDTETLSVAAHLVALACQRQQFYQMSIKDELTGLYTYRYFKERLAEEINRTRRYKMEFSLVIFDIDKFKSVNDTYGHPFGNTVLKAVAQIVGNAVRKGVDIPVRFGGEELSLILPHTNEKGALILAERIRQKVEALELQHDGKPVRITISGGISGFPTHGDEADVLLSKADTALYRAKQGGRNRIEMAE